MTFPRVFHPDLFSDSGPVDGTQLVNSHSDAIEALQAATDLAAVAAWNPATTYYVADVVLRNGVVYASFRNDLLAVDPATDGGVNWLSGTVGSLTASTTGLSIATSTHGTNIANILAGALSPWQPQVYASAGFVVLGDDGSGALGALGVWSSTAATTATDVPGASPLWREIDLPSLLNQMTTVGTGSPVGVVTIFAAGQTYYDESVSPPHGWIADSSLTWVSLI